MTELVTSDQVLTVAFTAQPVTVNGWTLDIETVMRCVSTNGWDGCYYRLKPGAAGKLAKRINDEKPWEALVPTVDKIRKVAGAKKAVTSANK